MQKIQYFNSCPTSYIYTTHTISTLFIKIDDVYVASWIQEITPILSDVILHKNLFHHATLWIQRTHLPTSIKYFCLNIISHSLPTSWKFYTQLSHATDF